MMLLTKSEREKLLENGRRQAAVKGTSAVIDFEPVVRLFIPALATEWLLTYIVSDEEDFAWGLCDEPDGLLGLEPVRLSKLESYPGRLGIRVERDPSFKAVGPISIYLKAAQCAALCP